MCIPQRSLEGGASRCGIVRRPAGRQRLGWRVGLGVDADADADAQTAEGEERFSRARGDGKRW